MDRGLFFGLAGMAFMVLAAGLSFIIWFAVRRKKAMPFQAVALVGTIIVIPVLGFATMDLATWVADNTSFVQKQVAIEQASNWRAEVLTKYLHHEQVPRKDMWWLDVSSGLVHCEPYITIFCEAEGISASDYTPVVLWREKMYSRLYEDFVGWLPPPDK